MYNSHLKLWENGYLAPLNKYIQFSDHHYLEPLRKKVIEKMAYLAELWIILESDLVESAPHKIFVEMI